MTSATMSGVFHIGGDLPVRRMGFGAMQLTGPGVWGPPADEAAARSVLRRAVELGVNFIDNRRRLRPGRQRTADPRGAASLSRRVGHRQQSGPGARRPPPLARTRGFR
ncbi:MAG: hypothetical protein WDM85_14590 [Caulobacteraceae bacterium]